MKAFFVLGITILCAAALANEPVDPRLDYAAHTLTFASNQLVNAVHQSQGDSHVTQDAETLFDAAEHFQEEVELGPEDLDVDYKTISDTFVEMAKELRVSVLVQTNETVRACWENTEDAFQRLRLNWLNHIGPSEGPCYGVAGYYSGTCRIEGSSSVFPISFAVNEQQNQCMVSNSSYFAATVLQVGEGQATGSLYGDTGGDEFTSTTLQVSGGDRFQLRGFDVTRQYWFSCAP